MGSSDADSEYIGKAAVAKILGVGVPTLRKMIQRGVLIPHDRPSGKKGRPWEVFRLSDVQHLRLSMKPRETDFRQVKSLALQALSAARRTEQRLTDFAARLGLDIPPLPRHDSYVQELYDSADQQQVHPNIVTEVWWLRFWSDTFFGIDEVYLGLVAHVTGDKEPWRRFFDFSSYVIRLMYLQRGAVPTHPKRVFEASREHLRYVGYMYCRQSQSAKVAGLVFDRRASAVDELSALLS